MMGPKQLSPDELPWSHGMGARTGVASV